MRAYSTPSEYTRNCVQMFVSFLYFNTPLSLMSATDDGVLMLRSNSH
jgi:hypothetical protein